MIILLFNVTFHSHQVNMYADYFEKQQLHLYKNRVDGLWKRQLVAIDARLDY